jgi:hypothetical protein
LMLAPWRPIMQPIKLFGMRKTFKSREMKWLIQGHTVFGMESRPEFLTGALGDAVIRSRGIWTLELRLWALPPALGLTSSETSIIHLSCIWASVFPSTYAILWIPHHPLYGWSHWDMKQQTK